MHAVLAATLRSFAAARRHFAQSAPCDPASAESHSEHVCRPIDDKSLPYRRQFAAHTARFLSRNLLTEKALRQAARMVLRALARPLRFE